MAGPPAKSLDERIDDLFDTVISLDKRSQKVEDEVARIGPRLDRFEDRMRSMEEKFTDFRSRVDTLMSIGKWVAGIAGASFLTIVILVVNVAFSAGRSESEVRSHGERIQTGTDAVERHDKVLQQVRTDLAEIKALLKAKQKGD